MNWLAGIAHYHPAGVSTPVALAVSGIAAAFAIGVPVYLRYLSSDTARQRRYDKDARKARQRARR